MTAHDEKETPPLVLAFVGRAVVLASILLFGAAEARADEVRLDPVSDAVALVGGGFLMLSIEALSAGRELSPQEPGDEDDLFFLDRSVANASSADRSGELLVSNVLLVAAVSTVAWKPLLTGLEAGVEEGLIDLGLYAEVALVNGAITDLVKIAVRRPRPIAYIEKREGTYDPDTNNALSFYSGHVSTVASLGAAMTYLEFLRHPRTARPWISMGCWTAATAAMGLLRVTSRSHFITDVLAGAVFGAGIGLLFPHLHRQRSPVLPAATVLDRGATVGVTGPVPW